MLPVAPPHELPPPSATAHPTPPHPHLPTAPAHLVCLPVDEAQQHAVDDRLGHGHLCHRAARVHVNHLCGAVAGRVCESVCGGGGADAREGDRLTVWIG